MTNIHIKRKSLLRDDIPRRLWHSSLAHYFHALIYILFSSNRLTTAGENCVKRDINTCTSQFWLEMFIIEWVYAPTKKWYYCDKWDMKFGIIIRIWLGLGLIVIYFLELEL